MFAVHTPQTVTLAVPGEDGPFATINFRTNGADTSRCVMEIISPEGDVQRLTFVTRGALVDTQFVSADNPEPDAPLSGQDFMVDGRDTRADNPYTHVAPVDADTAYRDGSTPGFKSPVPETDEERDAREDIERETLDAKKKLRADAEKRRDVQQKAQHLPSDRKAAHAPRYKALNRDDYDDAPHTGQKAPVAQDLVFPTTGETRNDPLVPAPSTALPGGEPAHPQDTQQLTERGAVNTTQSMSPARRGAGLQPVETP